MFVLFIVVIKCDRAAINACSLSIAAITTVMSSVGYVFNGISFIRSLLDDGAANLREMKLQIQTINSNLDSLDAFLHGAVYQIIHNLNRNGFARSYHRLNNFISVYARNNDDLPQE